MLTEKLENSKSEFVKLEEQYKALIKEVQNVELQLIQKQAEIKLLVELTEGV